MTVTTIAGFPVDRDATATLPRRPSIEPVAARTTFDWAQRLGPIDAPARAATPRARFDFGSAAADVSTFPARAWARALRDALLAPHADACLGRPAGDDPR